MSTGHGRVVELKVLKAERREQQPDAELEVDLMRAAAERPRFRWQCRGGERPCPFCSCRFHLAFDVTPGGGLQENFPGVPLEALPETCALDVADRGGHTLEEVGRLCNVTPVRIRQVEQKALRHLRRLRGEITRKAG